MSRFFNFYFFAMFLLINFIYGWRCAKQNELANLVNSLLFVAWHGNNSETHTHGTWWKEAAIET